MVKSKTRSQNLKRVFILAGEPSGDRLAADLMAGLKLYFPTIEIHGVGGPLMVKEGLKVVYPYDELAIMGLFEVLKHYRHLVRLKNSIAHTIIRENYDLVITVDSQDFSIRLAKELKVHKFSQPIIHYVLPTVWAWRANRITKVKQFYDHILYLFPFEKEILDQNAISGSFVGHPITRLCQITPKDYNTVIKSMGIDLDQDILLILPGSRKSEFKRSVPVFSATVNKVLNAHPRFQPVVVLAPNIVEYSNQFTEQWSSSIKFFDPRLISSRQFDQYKMALFCTSKIALAMSGSVSLELAASQTPMVIGYDFDNWFTRQIIKRMLLINTVTLVNLVSHSHSVPECLGTDFNSTQLSEELKKLIESQTCYQKQLDSFKIVMEKLAFPMGNINYPAAEAIYQYCVNQDSG